MILGQWNSLILLALVTAGCTSMEPSEKNKQAIENPSSGQGGDDSDMKWPEPTGNERIRFSFGAKVLELTVKDLAGIKSEAIAFLPNSNVKDRDQFRAELERGECSIDAFGAGRIGRWTLEHRQEELVLARNPPRADVMNVTLLHLDRRDGKWRVKGAGEEIVRARR